MPMAPAMETRQTRCGRKLGLKKAAIRLRLAGQPSEVIMNARMPVMRNADMHASAT